MTTPRRAIIAIDVQNEYFSGPLKIHHPQPQISQAAIASVLRAAVREELPVAVISHVLPKETPVFADGSSGVALRDAVRNARNEARAAGQHWATSSKQVGSALADEELLGWLRERNIDTLTLIGYMTNNCVLATAAHAELLGFAVEIISDATGAIHMSNSAGTASAQQVYDTVLIVLNSNWASVATSEQWLRAVETNEALKGSDLVSTAVAGAEAHR